MPSIKCKHYLLRIVVLCLLCCMAGEPHLNGHEYRPFTLETLPEPLLPMGYIPPALDNPSLVTHMSAEDILRHVNIRYEAFNKKQDDEIPNDPLKRLHQLMTSYDQISSLRYRRNVLSLPCQKALPELVDYIMNSRWYKEFLIPVSTDPIYDYSENTAMRIILSAHTAAHFFQIPFPTLFCLIFQESKFDFKIKSYTGALGLGQITHIAIKQINLIRKNEPLENRRLHAAANHIQTIYSDPVIDEILRTMGFYPMFPVLGDFPDHIKKFDPYSWKVVKEVSSELIRKGFSYGKNRGLVRNLIKRDLKGEVLRKKYAAVHPALLKITDMNYGKRFGTILNIETNIIISAMLLRHYINYEWILDKRKLHLRPSLAAIMAIAAYNQGPSVVREYLRYLATRYPRYKIEQATSKDHWLFLSKRGIRKALKKGSQRVDELFEHIRKITLCTEGECFE
ncbi:MAG: transglycosylase SLT domain-containing protein [Candidatus Magnetomorum sp.]|nr:transglycosylase SLT domain-containing protein [Candidatus Magnetomorum sp.]